MMKKRTKHISLGLRIPKVKKQTPSELRQTASEAEHRHLSTHEVLRRRALKQAELDSTDAEIVRLRKELELKQNLLKMTAADIAGIDEVILSR